MATFNPARQTRLYEDVAAQLREAVLVGTYAPGDRLPTERELMGEFGVSRAVVRQATMNLEHEGLVHVQVGAGGGTFVLESGIDAVCRAFENLFRHREVDLSSYLSAKRVLEPALTAAVVENSGPEHHRSLEDNLLRFRRTLQDGGSDDTLSRLSLEFHELLIQGTRNPVLEALMIALVRMAERVPAFRVIGNRDWPRMLHEHEELLDALRRGRKSRVARLLLEHLDTVANIYSPDLQAPAS